MTDPQSESTPFVSNAGALTFANTDPHSQNMIHLFVGGSEMLRISPDGFYVRGQKVPADENEARTVYEEFKSWLKAAHRK